LGPSTFAAVDADGRDVVVKTAVPGIAGSSLDRERAALEALGRGRHAGQPGLVQLAGVVDTGPVHAVATVRVVGSSLAEVLERDGPLGDVAVADALAPVAAALTAIHAEGWVHGDLSPANVVLGPDGAVLVDLGAAHRIGDPGARPTGTQGFTAPEVVAGAPTTTASDVWSLAAVLAVTATGRTALDPLPFDPAGRSELRPILRRALSPDPADRPGAVTVQAALAPGGEAAAGDPQPAAAAVVRRAAVDRANAAARRAAAPTVDYGPRRSPQVDVADDWSAARGTAALVSLATALTTAVLTFFGS
jgi:eukaryotic-like serine/threonine-protein kinase